MVGLFGWLKDSSGDESNAILIALYSDWQFLCNDVYEIAESKNIGDRYESLSIGEVEFINKAEEDYNALKLKTDSNRNVSWLFDIEKDGSIHACAL